MTDILSGMIMGIWGCIGQLSYIHSWSLPVVSICAIPISYFNRRQECVNYSKTPPNTKEDLTSYDGLTAEFCGLR